MDDSAFILNNDDPNGVPAGRGRRNRQATTASGQYTASQAMQQASLLRRRANAAARRPETESASTDAQTAGSFGGESSAQASTADNREAMQQPPTFPPQLTYFPENNTSFGHNPFYSGVPQQNQYLDWQYDPAQDHLYTMPGYSTDYSEHNLGDQDESFGTHWTAPRAPSTREPEDAPNDMANPTEPTGTSASNTDIVMPAPATAAVTSNTSTPVNSSTPANLRTFPQADSSISSSSVDILIPRKRKVGSVAEPAPSSSPSERAAIQRRPLVRRVDHYAPGVHDYRQRPQTPSLSQATPARQKENDQSAAHSDDEDGEHEDAPPAKVSRSRKEPDARSIRSVVQCDPRRAKVIEAGYPYVRQKVLTDEETMWIEGRAAITILSQEAFDYGAKSLGYDPMDFAVVMDKEVDLFRERVYSTRKLPKTLAREIITGPDGFGFIKCSADASDATLDETGEINRDQVALLSTKSALVYEKPSDRTIKGSMYKNAALQAMVNGTVFKNLLSDAVQNPTWFDEAPPPPEYADDPTTPLHKPRFSAVTLCLFICALRAAINEWSSGHWEAEIFSRKIYQPLFVSDLKTFRAWQEYTSNPTVLAGQGPTRTIPPSFLARTFQETIIIKARHRLYKDIVAPIPSTEVLDILDFAQNE